MASRGRLSSARPISSSTSAATYRLRPTPRATPLRVALSPPPPPPSRYHSSSAFEDADSESLWKLLVEGEQPPKSHRIDIAAGDGGVEIVEAGSGGGYGARVWDAGGVLAGHLAADGAMRAKLAAGATVLELGSGTGVVGITAACLGARVVLTDGAEALLPVMEANVARNARRMAAAGGACSVAPLLWGEADGDETAVQRQLAAVRAALSALTRGEGENEAEAAPTLILASDCLYSWNGSRQLLATLLALCGRRTEVLLSYTDRDAHAAEGSDGARFLSTCEWFFEAETLALGDTREHEGLGGMHHVIRLVPHDVHHNF